MMMPFRFFPDMPVRRLPRRLAACLVLLLAVVSAKAQYDPAFTHYWQLETQFNPAAAGRTPQLTINAAYLMGASGFEDAGGTMFAGANMAFAIGRTRHGVGVLFQNDAIGFFSHKRFAVQYAYHLGLFGGMLSIGAEVDMISESIDGSEADPGEEGDPAIPSGEVTGSKFDASAGLYYSRGPLYAAFSVLHVTAPTVLIGETNELDIRPLYNFTAGYNIRMRNPLFNVTPSVMMRYDGTDFRADITARLAYSNDRKQIYGGAGYSPSHSVMLFVGGMFHGVDVSYSYEANTSGMGIMSGFHEITLAYRLDLDMGKKGKNKHKSVRFL